MRMIWVPSPTWPAMFSPQPYRDPSALRASVCFAPPATATNPVPTRVGEVRLGSGSSPSWPQELSPQFQSAPSVAIAYELEPPTAADAKPVPMRTGVVRIRSAGAMQVWTPVTAPPMPSSLQEFVPHAHSEPSVFTASVWYEVLPDAATDAKPVPTGTGELRFVVEPSPSWPYSLYPHAYSAPPALSPNAPWIATAIEVNPEPTRTGEVLGDVEPLPRSPCMFSPHAYTEPSRFSATVCP